MEKNIILILMLATLAVLVTGIVVMAVGGKYNKKYANKLMSLRVFLQGVCIALIAASVALLKN